MIEKIDCDRGPSDTPDHCRDPGRDRPPHTHEDKRNQRIAKIEEPLRADGPVSGEAAPTTLISGDLEWEGKTSFAQCGKYGSASKMP